MFRYEIKGLLQLLEDHLARRVTVDNVLSILALAWKPGSTSLQRACSHCLKSCNLAVFKEKEEWKEIFGDASDLVAALMTSLMTQG